MKPIGFVAAVLFVLIALYLLYLYMLPYNLTDQRNDLIVWPLILFLLIVCYCINRFISFYYHFQNKKEDDEITSHFSLFVVLFFLPILLSFMSDYFIHETKYMIALELCLSTLVVTITLEASYIYDLASNKGNKNTTITLKKPIYLYEGNKIMHSNKWTSILLASLILNVVALILLSSMKIKSEFSRSDSLIFFIMLMWLVGLLTSVSVIIGAKQGCDETE